MGLTFASLLLAVAVAEPVALPDEPTFLIPSARAGNSDLFLVDPIKGDAKNITKSEQAEELYPAWSPDGKRIAFACKTREHELEIYSCDADGSNRKRLTTSEPQSGCLAPTWSADGKSLAYIRMIQGGKHETRIVTFDGSEDKLLLAESSAPTWSPDGKRIALVCKPSGKPHALCTVSPDGTNLKVLTEDLGPDAPFFPAWSPDGKHIALAIANEYGWQLALVPATGGQPRQITHLPGFNLNPVWLSADRILFAHTVQPGSSNGAYVSIKTDGTRLAIHPLSKVEPPHAIGRPAVYLPRIAPKPEAEANPVRPAAYVEPGAIKRSAIKVTPVAILPPTAPGAISNAAWSADGKRFALSFEAGIVFVGEFAANAIRPIEAFRGHEGTVEAVAFSSDGKLVYSVGADKSLRTWDIASKGSKTIETDHDAGIDSLALGANGKFLATGDRDGKVKVRDAATTKPEREIAVCEARRGAVHALAFGKDDAVLYAGCAKWGMPVLNGCVAAYDPGTGKELWRTKGTMGGVFALAVSPDGTKLAGACLDTFIRIWDAKTGAELSCWKGHADRATGVVWALGGKVLVSSGFDHTVRVWDAGSGTILHTLAAHASPVFRVAVSPDGKHVISTGQAGAVCFWRLDDGGY